MDNHDFGVGLRSPPVRSSESVMKIGQSTLQHPKMKSLAIRSLKKMRDFSMTSGLVNKPWNSLGLVFDHV